MPFVNHCFRYMWQYPAASKVLSIDRPSSFFKFIETFTNDFYKLLLHCMSGFHRDDTVICFGHYVGDLWSRNLASVPDPERTI